MVGGRDAGRDLVLGVDGGGTKTVGVLATTDGTELRRAEAGPANIHAVGAAGVDESLAGLLGVLLPGAEDVDRVGASVFGFAGTGREEDAREMAAAVARRGLTHRAAVTTDARIALHGALVGGPGLLLIAGTGSMCYGRDASGRESRAGGWGHLLDDVGSAYDLGMSSLRAVARQTDGRQPASPWGSATLRAAGADADGLIRWTARATKRDIAALAPVALAAAADGDPAAAALVGRAAADLASLVAAAAPALDLGPAPAVALTGGLLLNDAPYRALVVAAIARDCPQAVARAPVHDAAWGAVMMARDLLKEGGHDG